MLSCGHSDIAELVRAAPSIAPRLQAPDDLAATFYGTPSRRVEAKEHVFCEGDPAKHIYRVESGLICTYRMMADGRRQVVDFAFPGDIVGLGAGNDHTISAQAIRPSRLRCLPAASLQEIIRHDPLLTAKLYETISEELRAARELLLSVCKRSAAERLAAFLIALVQRNQRKGLDSEILDLSMTRSDIADFLGLTIETVSRTFTKFRVAGLIDIAQRTAITIVDQGGLEALAAGTAIE